VKVAPSGPKWVHEIKHDGYRLMVRRTPAGIRIKTRRGYDWTPELARGRHRLGADADRPDGASARGSTNTRASAGVTQPRA
jgi:ATP-dependent DNA ligase